MSVVRCPSCTAAVPADAGWCSLCFADLRGVAAAAPLAAVAAATTSPGELVVAAPVGSAPVGSAPTSSAPTSSAPGLAEPAVLQPVPRGPAPALSGPRWDCRCGERVAFGELTCPVCGHQPLATPTLPAALRLSDPRARVGVMLGGGLAVLVVAVLVLAVAGWLL